jgi:hypothetical protein
MRRTADQTPSKERMPMIDHDIDLKLKKTRNSMSLDEYLESACEANRESIEAATTTISGSRRCSNSRGWPKATPR